MTGRGHGQEVFQPAQDSDARSRDAHADAPPHTCLRMQRTVTEERRRSGSMRDAKALRTGSGSRRHARRPGSWRSCWPQRTSLGRAWRPANCLRSSQALHGFDWRMHARGFSQFAGSESNLRVVWVRHAATTPAAPRHGRQPHRHLPPMLQISGATLGGKRSAVVVPPQLQPRW